MNHPFHSASEPPSEESSLEIKGLLHALLRRLWLILLGAAALGAAAAFYVSRLPAQYESRAVLQIEASKPAPVVGGEERSENDLHDPLLQETVVESFRNRSLLQGVGRKLKLAEDASFLQHKDGLPADENEVLNRLSAGLTVVPRPKTILMDVAFHHPDPKVAQVVAAGITEQFLLQDTELQLNQAEAQNRLLAQKASELRAKVDKSETAVQAYKNNAETVSMDSGRNLVEQKLQNLNTSLSEARNARLKVESDLRLLQSGKDRSTARLLTVDSVANDTEVAAALTRVKTLEEEIHALEDRYRAKHPRMIEAHNRLEEAKTALAAAVKNAPERISARFDAAAASEQTIQKAVTDQEKELLRVDKITIPYRALQQELEADRALYDAVTKKLKESSVLMDVKPMNFRVVEPATGAYQLKSYRALIIAGASIVGALLIAALLAAIYFLDASIKTVDDAERLLGLPVLSAVPVLGKVKAPADLLALLSRPDSPVAESYRSLRTALSLLGPATERKVLLFTSAIPNEGKTLTAANVAIAFAQQGLRTLVLEADLRKPTLGRMFLGADQKYPGIAEFLVGETPEPRPTEIPNLFVLPAGGLAPNPAELLSGPRFGEMISHFKEKYDRLIIDTAPVNVVSDTLSIIGMAQTVILVVRHGFTSRKAVRRALELMHRAHVKADGVVLNMMPQWSGIGHHYYYSSNSKYGGEGTYGASYPDRPQGNLAQPAAR